MAFLPSSFRTHFLPQLRVTLKSLRPFPSVSAKEKRQRERQLLRETLRAYPFWIQGHYRLGMLVSEQEARATDSRDPRAVATVRACAKAILQLLLDQTLSDEERKMHQLRASFLLGMSHFLFREFEKADEFFKEVLDPKYASYVEAELGLRAMEHAGFVALTLGDEAQALRYFEALPSARKSPEIQAALSLLREKFAAASSG